MNYSFKIKMIKIIKRLINFNFKTKVSLDAGMRSVMEGWKTRVFSGFSGTQNFLVSRKVCDRVNR